MDYLMTFIEGLLTFVSPCVLPMIPMYLTYLIGENRDTEIKLDENKQTKKETDKKQINKKSNKKLYLNSLFFILGFTVIFMLLGLFSSTLGVFLVKYKLYINIVFGVLLIIFGLNFIGIFKLGFLNTEKKIKKEIRTFNILTSFLFGLVFALGWTPCVGPFLASAMMRAASKGTILIGGVLLAIYSLGIGIPFFLSAVFLAKLKSTFSFIKKHYKIINYISGAILIILGVLKVLNIY